MSLQQSISVSDRLTGRDKPDKNRFGHAAAARQTTFVHTRREFFSSHLSQSVNSQTAETDTSKGGPSLWVHGKRGKGHTAAQQQQCFRRTRAHIGYRCCCAVGFWYEQSFRRKAAASFLLYFSFSEPAVFCVNRDFARRLQAGCCSPRTPSPKNYSGMVGISAKEARLRDHPSPRITHPPRWRSPVSFSFGMISIYIMHTAVLHA